MKQIFLILCFLGTNYVIINAQTWNNYSDSLINSINKEDTVGAKHFEILADSVMRKYKNKNDLNFANYIYAKGVFCNITSPDNSIKLLKRALNIYKDQKTINYSRIRKINYFLGKAFYTSAIKNKSKHYFKKSYNFYDNCNEILKKQDSNSQIDRRIVLYNQIIILDKLKDSIKIRIKAQEYLGYYRMNFNLEFDFNLILICRINNDLITQEEILNDYLNMYNNDSLKKPKLLLNIYFELFNNYLSRKSRQEDLISPDLVIKYGEIALNIYEKEKYKRDEKLKLLLLGLQWAYSQKKNNIKSNDLQKKLDKTFGELDLVNAYEHLRKLEREEKYEELKVEFINYENTLIAESNIGGLVELYSLALSLYEKLIIFNKSDIEKRLGYLKSKSKSMSNKDLIDFDSIFIEFYYLSNEKLKECLEICSRYVEYEEVSQKLYFLKFKAQIENDLNLPSSTETSNKYLKIAIDAYGAKSPMTLEYYVDILSEQQGWGKDLINQNFINQILSIIYENKLYETEIAAKAWYYIGIHAKNINNKSDWLKYINLSKSYFEKHGDNSSFGFYNLCIIELIEIDIKTGDFEDAKMYLDILKEYLEKINPNDNTIKSGYYWALGDYCFYQKLYKDAYESYNECLKIGLNNIAIKFKLIICKSQLEDNTIKTIHELEEFQNEYKLDLAVDYLYLLKYNLSDLEGSKKILIDIINKEIEIVENSFHLLSEDEMIAYYKSMSKSFEYLNNHLLNKNDPTFLANYISLHSFHKSLLTSSLAYKNDNNTYTDTLIQKVKYNNNQISKWYEGNDKNIQIIDDLKFQNRELEKIITSKNNNKPLNITVDKIKNLLKNEEAYVEIIRISKQSTHSIIAPNIINDFTDSIFYGAIIIRKNTPEKFIIINNNSELEKSIIHNYKNRIFNKYKDNKSYHLIFEPIEKELHGIKSIYLVTDGVYNLINIESLYNPQKNEYIIDYLKIQLLQNAHSLFSKDNNQELKKISKFEIFGNPLFSFEKMNNNLDSINNYRSAISETTKKTTNYVSIKTLPGSKYEIDNIARIINESGYKINVYTGKYANEDNLKNVISPYLLHIATHGYFLNDDSSSTTKNLLRNLYNNKFYKDPSLNSGLLLAGAEIALNNPLDKSINNGIFTAMEARTLNLKNTELVVLSACETGLGESVQGIGMINLPRNFIISGANAVIMSLWQVDDIATQDLMTKFYSNWITSKMSKEDALYKAKIDLKKLHPEAYYWAGFILIK
jgi:CHAT domain-containing protein